MTNTLLLILATLLLASNVNAQVVGGAGGGPQINNDNMIPGIQGDYGGSIGSFLRENPFLKPEKNPLEALRDINKLKNGDFIVIPPESLLDHSKPAPADDAKYLLDITKQIQFNTESHGTFEAANELIEVIKNGKYKQIDIYQNENNLNFKLNK